MSRKQPQHYVDAQQLAGKFEEEEAVSGAGEDDEVMEDAQGEEEEGYSELLQVLIAFLSFSTTLYLDISPYFVLAHCISECNVKATECY